MLVAYHIDLLREMRNDPLSTSLGLAGRTRALWVQTIMKSGKDILAVQTLRNWTMAAPFLSCWAPFMINLPVDAGTEISVEDVVETLDRGGTHYTLGMRGYYLAIPLALWLFGPLWMLAGALLLLVTRYRLDRSI